jgi:hypothetical protein
MRFADDSLRSLFNMSDRNFFRNLCWLATYDDKIADDVKALYQTYIDDLAIIIKQLMPSLSDDACLQRSTIIVSLYEGLGLVVDLDLEKSTAKPLIETTHESALQIALLP